MKKSRQLFAVVCALLFSAVFAARSNADEWNKKTIVTFSDSVEIPGQVLPAGSYVFKLLDSSSDRHIVQVWTADQRQLIATIMAIPAQRTETRDRTTITFDERPGNSPMALRTWFYPGDTIGQEFVYRYPPEMNYAYGTGSH
jgi:hypothetical protein